MALPPQLDLIYYTSSRLIQIVSHPSAPIWTHLPCPEPVQCPWTSSCARWDISLLPLRGISGNIEEGYPKKHPPKHARETGLYNIWNSHSPDTQKGPADHKIHPYLRQSSPCEHPEEEQQRQWAPSVNALHHYHSVQCMFKPYDPTPGFTVAIKALSSIRRLCNLLDVPSDMNTGCRKSESAVSKGPGREQLCESIKTGATFPPVRPHCRRPWGRVSSVGRNKC